MQQAAAARSRALTVVLEGASLPPGVEHVVSPLVPEVERVTPLGQLGGGSVDEILEELARTAARQSLLVISARGLVDRRGSVVRGGALLGQRIAMVSILGLAASELEGVIRHEMAHAWGLEHCSDASCALSDRPSPQSIADRGSELCLACRGEWESRIGVGLP
jgi:hypothetical protein